MVQVSLLHHGCMCPKYSTEERWMPQCTTVRERIFRGSVRGTYPLQELRCAGGTTGPLSRDGRDGKVIDQSSRSEDAGVSVGAENEGVESEEKKTLWKRFKNAFLGGGLDKAKIKALGIGAVLSYGFISNVSYGSCVAIAWITHVKRTGLSPLVAGQWSGFLAVYAGLWTLQNFLRPMRFGLAVALTPAVNKLMEHIMDSWGWSKGQAFGFLMLVLGVGTAVIVGSAIWILGGFPPSPNTA